MSHLLSPTRTAKGVNTRSKPPGSSSLTFPRRNLSKSNRQNEHGSSASTSYPLDVELQAEMRQFLGDSPMRFGPAVIPSALNVREHLVKGASIQLTTYVSLRTLSEVKKKYRRATDEQVLRIVQFCRFHDELSYDLLKNSRPHYFHLTAKDRQRDIEENRLVVPIPQLRLMHHPHSRVLYFRPSRFSPRHQSKATVVDSIIYVLDSWTKHDAVVWSKQNYTSSPVTYCMLVHLQDFEKESHYTKEYWSKLMALLQGRLFPVQVGMVLWVDPPPSFEKVRKRSLDKMILSNEFEKNNFFISRNQLKDHLRPGFEGYLPRDEFPDLCPLMPEQGDTMTLAGMAREYLLFQRYLETLQGMSETHPSLSKKKRGKGGRRSGRNRRFTLPLKIKKKRRPKHARDLGLESDAVEVEESTGHFDAEDDEDDDEYDGQEEEDDEDADNDDDEEEDDDDDDDDEGTDTYDDGDNSSYVHEGSVDGQTRRSKGIGGKIKKFRKKRKEKKAAKKEAKRASTETEYGYEVTNHQQPQINKSKTTRRNSLNNVVERRVGAGVIGGNDGVTNHQQPQINKSKTTRRNSLNNVVERRVGAGVIGGKPVKHRRQRRSSLSVLEELHHEPDIEKADAVNAEPPSPSTRRRRRISMKTMFKPLKLRRGRRGGGSRGSGPGDDSSISHSIISDSVRSNPQNGFDESFQVSQLAHHPQPHRSPRHDMRRHSSVARVDPAAISDSNRSSDSNTNRTRNIENSNQNFEDSNNSNNSSDPLEDSTDWTKIMHDMHKQSSRGLGLVSPIAKTFTSPQKSKATRRHSSFGASLPAPPLAASSPKRAESKPGVVIKKQEQEKAHDLSFFLDQVERSKERTRRLQMQRKAGNTSVS
jgi:hypothetical protein